MLKKRIITTMLWNGETLVKGNQFINSRRAGSAITTIKIYNSRDVDEIVFFDINKNDTKDNYDLDFIRQLTDECNVPITIGGGIKEIYQIDDLLFAGADKVSINSENYSNINLLKSAAKKFGSQTIVAAIDYKKIDGNIKCVSKSGKIKEEVHPLDWAAKCEDLGAGELILTSIDKDGLMLGYDYEILEQVCNRVNIPVIISGGAGNYTHFLKAFMSGASAVAAASIYHFTEQTPSEAKKFLLEKNIPVRQNFNFSF